MGVNKKKVMVLTHFPVDYWSAMVGHLLVSSLSTAIYQLPVSVG
jgi:hypothetical protein